MAKKAIFTFVKYYRYCFTKSLSAFSLVVSVSIKGHLQLSHYNILLLCINIKAKN